MNSIFWGLIFIFLDFTVNVNEYRVISLIPTFVGYILICKGINELEDEHSTGKFGSAYNCSVGMVVYWIIMYIMDMFGVSTRINSSESVIVWVLITVVSIVVLLVQANIMFGIINAMSFIENNEGISLNSERLHSLYKTTFVITMVTIVVLYIPLVNLLAVVGILVSFIVEIMFMVNFYKSKSIYCERKNGMML